MNLMQMKFRDFTWPYNPTELQVKQSRTLRETVLPFAGSRVENLGAGRRKVSGRGYFAGEDCMETFRRLERVFAEGTAGSLQLPGQAPFPALMEKLELIHCEGKNLLEYIFSFTETERMASDFAQNSYTAVGGESLWDIAFGNGIPAADLIRLNPHIRDIDGLKTGEKVVFA